MTRGLALLALLASPLPAAAETVAIVAAKLWTGEGDAPVENATVVIADGRIVSAGAGAPPTGARIIDGRGRVVTPPLDAAATQIGLVEVAGASDTDDRGVASGPIGAAFDIAPAFDANALPVQEARAQGVLRALIYPDAGGRGGFAGQAARIRLGADTASVERPRAAMVVHVGGGEADGSGGSRGAAWTLLAEAIEEARRFADDPKAFANRDPRIGRADARALRAVVERRVPLAVFAHRESDIRQAVAFARSQRVRLVVLGGAEAWRAAALLAAERVPVILDPLDDLPFRYDMIGARRDNAALLARAGVAIGFIVSGQGIYLSYNVGPAMREGAGVAVANGLPYATALRAVTGGAAAIWNDAQRTVIAPGEPADLVLWDGDPLEPASAPVAIFADGREVSRVTRQTLLRDRYRPATR